MDYRLKILLEAVGWAILLVYTVFAVRLCSTEQEDITLQDISINIHESDSGTLVDSQTVEDWLKTEGLVGVQLPMKDIDTEKIKNYLESKAFIKQARVYSDMNGKLTIDIRKRIPIVRVNSINGYNFYISEDGWIMPYQPGSSVYVPIITGYCSFPFTRDYHGPAAETVDEAEKKSDQNYLYLLKLINFVRLITADEFWNAQIVQINLSRNSSNTSADVELIPRIGKHIVVLGQLDNAEEKLSNLLLFYNKVLQYEGWDKYSTVDLRYKDQVVCR